MKAPKNPIQNGIHLNNKESIPFVTVIMPVRNEAAYIERSLGSVMNQDYPAESMEVIIVDGMSTDGTREIIKDWQSSFSNLMLIDNPGRIVPTGLNVAIRAAKGDIIIRVDGHCEISPDYVSRCVEHLNRDQVEGVGGPIETVGENFIAQVIATAMSSTFGVGGSAFRTIKDRELLADTVPFPAYPRRVIDQAGYYDEELMRNQDDEFNYRIRKMGGKLLLCPDIRSYYYSRSSLASLWRQYFQYGFYKVRVLQKHPRQMSIRQFVPPIFVLALFSCGLLAIFSPMGRLLLGLMVVLYFCVDIFATLAETNRNNWRYIFILPLVFPILHLSYGLGFLLGLVHFTTQTNHKPIFNRDNGKYPLIQEADFETDSIAKTPTKE
jgi:succinoglycan biosynthesis protein ExoA